MAREEFGDAPRFNFEKISSKEFVLSVPAVVRGPFTATDVTSAMPRRKGPRKRASSVIFVLLAV
jgi:hypothetical protein